ncbi:MAG TPA: hypothetical protein PKA53_03210, partial [Sphingobacterium sp.]|nr:hypothetical protein [Sphingobacterium sp.]
MPVAIPRMEGFNQNKAIRFAHSFFCLTDFAQASLAYPLNRKTRLLPGFILIGGEQGIRTPEPVTV